MGRGKRMNHQLLDEINPPEFAALTYNAVEILPKDGLQQLLASKRQLRVKLGIDLTSPDLHLGRGVVLQRLRAFQDAGHKAILILGDATTKIGDPSGRNSERPLLTQEQIVANEKTYLTQASRVLNSDPELLEVRHNSEWLECMDLAQLITLSREFTVAQLLERDDFSKRFSERKPIALSELLYPLLQAQDSVAVNADIELGGTDQLYNLLAGRTLMNSRELAAQVIMTFPILRSWDGAKMSSSAGNNIALDCEPSDMFGKVMRISDELLDEWYQLLKETPRDERDPMKAKLQLASWLVERSHGAEAATAAGEYFQRTVRDQKPPENMKVVAIRSSMDKVHLPAFLAQQGFAPSRNIIRRLITEGAVKIDGVTTHELDITSDELRGKTIRIGKRGWLKIDEIPSAPEYTVVSVQEPAQ
jgi:tyrosyl-tRNA synthetase